MDDLILIMVIGAAVALMVKGESVLYWLGLKDPTAQRGDAQQQQSPPAAAPDASPQRPSTSGAAFAVVALVAVGHVVYTLMESDTRRQLNEKVESLERQINSLDSQLHRLRSDLDTLSWRVSDIER